MNDAIPSDPPGLVADAGDRPEPGVSVVTVAYGPEPWLRRSVTAALASQGVDVEVVVIDNGGTGGLVDELRDLPGVTVVGHGENLGFTTACNLGVSVSTRPFVALVNPDALVAPHALAELVRCAGRPEVALATAAVVMADDHAVLNSAGNDVHYLGVSWSGCFGERLGAYRDPRPVTAASGAGLACRREVWDALGGFAEPFFAYYEDADLSLRAWQRGWEVVYVPTAIVAHRYEFSRNPVKYRLLERNRLALVLTCFGPRQLWATWPMLVALEGVMLAYAAREGWLGAKVSGYGWLIRRRRWLRDRRRLVQMQRTEPESALVARFTDRLQPGNVPPPRLLLPFDRLLRAYWHLVRRFI